ncbi:hypothetical protein GGTG_14214 [Gaeumannomyces tritici R3-111a-1]|uniref:Uncharacterized protein n=1 Tax=Gaeumannomyces tritici (strain R3-111a-1) TaxID=644352 RepID=J3PKY8_GAET3|nr:hypothetical protein GGTG_14214 [Gaeumannomyces tritici R3-111a-1]EJT68206.1 hypothetical protein GGTG_14214 [Gaeumannomyces tritici R3-111a-1]
MEGPFLGGGDRPDPGRLPSQTNLDGFEVKRKICVDRTDDTRIENRLDPVRELPREFHLDARWNRAEEVHGATGATPSCAQQQQQRRQARSIDQAVGPSLRWPLESEASRAPANSDASSLFAICSWQHRDPARHGLCALHTAHGTLHTRLHHSPATTLPFFFPLVLVFDLFDSIPVWPAHFSLNGPRPTPSSITRRRQAANDEQATRDGGCDLPSPKRLLSPTHQAISSHLGALSAACPARPPPPDDTPTHA